MFIYIVVLSVCNTETHKFQVKEEWKEVVLESFLNRELFPPCPSKKKVVKTFSFLRKQQEKQTENSYSVSYICNVHWGGH